MASLVPFNQQQIEELRIHIPPKTRYGRHEFIFPYIKRGNTVSVPFAYGRETALLTDDPPSTTVSFTGTLRGPQRDVIQRCLAILNDHQSLLLSAYTGFGKTVLALALLAHIKYKTVIIVNFLTLLEQWDEAIKKVLQGAKIQILTPNTKADPDCDIYLINVMNVHKHFGNPVFARSIRTVIVDEVHLILSKIFSKALLTFHPDYLIGLSATPFRFDELHALFDRFFGTETLVYIPLHRPHTVKVVYTSFVPQVDTTRTGWWGDVLAQQAMNEQRNALIVKCVVDNPTRKFLILCKRVSHIQALTDEFVERNIVVEQVYGAKKVVRGNTRTVLIGTIKKLGVGFDEPDLDTLIVAADLKQYFIQYLGRVFRRPDADPWIFDLVDRGYHPLYRHFLERKAVYLKSGAIME